MLLASRDIVGGINWVQENEDRREYCKDAEKQKKHLPAARSRERSLVSSVLVQSESWLPNAVTHLGMEVYGYDPYVSVDSAWRLSRSIHIQQM